ncbi:manganese-dependent inorganic pyrophosphatase [Thermosyntropha lipolytica DSM 11003]|uniref:inorganic diphosphatase n=1 Tax=Thermosyntropha lipolytica DSM 11003 TaxID=1123382 RepID=A0A1M5J7K2_9FIRM|nr:putative manganese-dependent inorganic diphosphatase [Thermosyntropha lipolytica]SHG36522.1 manganese-dependent inorganic pyrophosphatase [Thermosyntropha lipolytica DSM 11003]
MKPVYVIGHKNPDIDSVAAAISYKVYKQATDEGIYVAAAAGELSEDIVSLLHELEFEMPLVLENVYTTAEDLLEDKDIIYATADMSIIELGNIMRRYNIKTMPVLDEDRKFLGLLTIGDLAMIFMDNLGGGRDIEESPRILREIFNYKVADIMKTRDLVLFEKDEPVGEVRKMMLSTRYRNYPVVDENNYFLGMVSRHNLLAMKRKKLILVDHNERKQAVNGIEEAEVLEIVDHHRIGDVETISPIYFRNEPVGSTCTLIGSMFLESRMHITNKLAALMLSGILSDTMIFKSPTTTEKDRQVARKLGEFSGLDLLEWGKKIFNNSDHLERLSDEELLNEDLKEYKSGNTVFAISQVETLDLEKLAERKKGLIKAMQEICHKRNYAFMCLMVTDIMEEATELIISGEKSFLVEQAFGNKREDGSIFLKGVMSRKKQVVPVLYEALRKANII